MKTIEKRLVNQSDKARTIILFVVLLLSFHIYSQEETKKEKRIKNTIKYNITNPALFGATSVIFGYERTMGNHQSISIDVGQVSLPRIFTGTGSNIKNVQAVKGGTDKGYHFGIDCRFYLKTENKFPAPRGVYLAPYYSYNHFERTNTWSLTSPNFNGEVNTNFQFNFNTIGFEIGYQFVLWKRFSIDCLLFGPGLARYNLKTTINTTLSMEDQELLFKEINDAMQKKIPGYSLVIPTGEYERKGSVSTNNFAYRFMISLGFRF